MKIRNFIAANSLFVFFILLCLGAGGLGCDTETVDEQVSTDSETESESETDPLDVPCDAGGDDYWEAGWAAIECEVLHLSNAYRAAGADCGPYGYFSPAPPLVMQHQLQEAARLHSEWMGATGIVSHDSPDGPNGYSFADRIESAGYTGYAMVGENVAAGQETPEIVVQNWIDSPDHCQNLMNPLFTEIGVGYAYYESFSMYHHYWTQTFGAWTFY